jgi:hypothetical protein
MKSKVDVDEVDDEAPRVGVLSTSVKKMSKTKLKVNVDEVDDAAPRAGVLSTSVKKTLKTKHVDDEVVVKLVKVVE